MDEVEHSWEWRDPRDDRNIAVLTKVGLLDEVEHSWERRFPRDDRNNGL